MGQATWKNGEEQRRMVGLSQEKTDGGKVREKVRERVEREGKEGRGEEGREGLLWALATGQFLLWLVILIT